MSTAQMHVEHPGARPGPRFTSRLVGPWPRVAQLTWLALLLLILVILVFRARLLLYQTHEICGEPHCEGAQVTRGLVRQLHNFGLTSVAYGIYIAAVEAVSLVVYGAVAAILMWRRSSDGMAVFTAFTLLLLGGLTLDGSSTGQPAGPLALQITTAILSLLGAYGMILFFYLFPDGRLVLRWPGLLLIPWIIQEPALYFSRHALPAVSGPLYAVGWVAALGSVIYVQVYRYRKVSNLVERQQTKWVVYGVTLGLLGLLATLLLAHPGGLPATATVLLVIPIDFTIFIQLIPLSIGFAMLRYRLWDVDVLINRTLVYSLLTACLAFLYVSGVVLLQALFRALTGQGSGLAVAISTLAIAALFQPLRRGTQSFIDRRFYRRKYDAARTLAAFSAHLRDDVDLDQVSAEIVTVIRETMHPTHVSIWLR